MPYALLYAPLWAWILPQQALAFRWILAASRSKKGKPMSVRLSSELLDAYKKEGAAMTTRENVHRMAEANKAFAHFAW